MKASKWLWAAAPLLFAFAAVAQDQTVVKDPAEEDLLLGARQISLQWIGWEHLGPLTVEKKDGLIKLTGKQEQKKGEDFLKVEGVVTEVRERAFVFKGTILTRVSYIAGGKECPREGSFTFRRTGKRRYWRLQQMQNPCEGVVDYVDVFLPTASPTKK